MRSHRILSFAIIMVLVLAWVVGRPGMRPLSAQQTGGLPALERRVAALEALVKSLQQTNTSQAAEIAALKNRLDQAELGLAALDAGLMVVEAKTAPLSLTGTELTFTGVNVRIVSGSGSTDDGVGSGGTLTGLGNLIIGYPGDDSVYPRTGSHNLVLGDHNGYTSYGGLVVGQGNQILGPYCTITGGTGNTARNYWSSVNGGFSNLASGQGAVVNGGQQNTASESYATVSGGYLNVVTAFRGWAGGAYHTP